MKRLGFLETKRTPRYSMRKLNVGMASVLLGVTIFGINFTNHSVKAATTESVETNTQKATITTEKVQQNGASNNATANNSTEAATTSQSAPKTQGSADTDIKSSTAKSAANLATMNLVEISSTDRKAAGIVDHHQPAKGTDPETENVINRGAIKYKISDDNNSKRVESTGWDITKGHYDVVLPNTADFVKKGTITEKQAAYVSGDDLHNIFLTLASNQVKAPTDTTTPIAPSTTVPSYDGTKVVHTPFYNNPRGTNSKLLDSQAIKNGQYTIYFTAKDASGKEYASSYAVEQNNHPQGVGTYSLLDKDAGAYDPNSLEFHFYYQNNSDQNQTLTYKLIMPYYFSPNKTGHPESSLVPDGSRISDVKVTSKQGNTYDISSVTDALDKVKLPDGDLRYVKQVPVDLTVKANDAINLVIPFVLNKTAKESTTKIDDNNDFKVYENGKSTPTAYLNVRSSTYAPLYPEDKIYPVVKVGNNTYTHDYPDNPGAFTLDPSVYRDEDFQNNFWGKDGPYGASTSTNKSTVYGSYTSSFLLLDEYERQLTKRGFTVCFSKGKPVPYYTYYLYKSGAKFVDKNGNPGQGETKGLPYFEVVPVILLNQDETYTTKTAPTAWDPSTMVNKVADPTNYRYWDQKTDSAVRMDNTAAQLTAKDFTVTITRDGQAVKPDANGKYDLSKPGTYTVTYSRDFNGTTISNSGKITVTPVKEPDNPSDNHNNNGNNDNNGGNNSDAIVPINPSDNNSNNSNTAPTDNKKTDDTKKDNTGKKITKKTPKKVKNNKSNKIKSTTTSKSNQSSKTKHTTQTKKPTRTNRTDDISPKANVMNITKRTTKSGTISPKAVALANTTVKMKVR